MKRLLTITCCLLSILAKSQLLVTETPSSTSFLMKEVQICVDKSDESLVQLAAGFLQTDLLAITGNTPIMSSTMPARGKVVVIVGSLQKSSLVKKLIADKKISLTPHLQKWEGFSIQTIPTPYPGIEQAVVIVGNERRGTAYGVFELSKLMGVSPWYWWADVPVVKKKAVYLPKKTTHSDAPAVKYRGIFINDEAPALSNWSREKFGGFNHKFYSKVFELILRLKGNFIWPAMWGNAFYDDDSLNIKIADQYGIVIGTSHHEPLMRAHDEWRRYGKGKWDYNQNPDTLSQFWEKGLERAKNEKIVTIGMRGDGDEPMSRETATALLEKIVAAQREIIEKVSGKPAKETTQVWALYKEVQDYYDKGMRVPDDVTLLLCDDNWGNIRRLPDLNQKDRPGGYGIYYHFDYVGGPRNYKWINTNPLPRIWEQMHLAWEYNVRNIWIVNVGDIKPMEYPISFFLDYAWNPEKIDADDLQRYSEEWAAAQFGKIHAKEIAFLLNRYGKYNSRRKPEMLDARTYSMNYNEWKTVVTEYNDLHQKAEEINRTLPENYRDAYFQLVLHPVWASANLNELYYNVALNHEAYTHKWAKANDYAERVKAFYAQDSLITLQYHQLNNGKWNHMMSQTHIGYTYWQQPPRQRMPQLRIVTPDSVQAEPKPVIRDVASALPPADSKGNVFYESEENGVSIEAHHFTRDVSTNNIKWKILPDLGRTGSSITPFPVTAPEQKPGGNAPHVEYDIYTISSGECTVNTYFSPTLNLHNTEEGLQYAISIDDEAPQIFSINKEDKNTGTGIWNKWVGENIIIKASRHNISKAGKHTIKYWMVNPAVVLQKIVVDFGNNKPSYLGPPETLHLTTKK